ncbi:MAG: cation diffusion facilitator family transporter [Planctomycetota bacterium]
MTTTPTHDHREETRSRNLGRLRAVLVLVLVYMVAEFVGGFLTNSLALLADAGHMLSDAGSLGLALFALWIARRPGSRRRTFGHHRAEVLAALANGVALVAIAGYVVVEAWSRFSDPGEVDGRALFWIATGGLVVNLVGLRILHGGRDDSLNVRGAWLHAVADTLGSVQAIVAGGLVWAFGWNVADPIASLVIALLVVRSAWSLLRDSVDVLLEAAPLHVDVEEVRRAIADVAGVVGVHDLHVWTITSGFESLSVHAVVEGREHSDVLRDVRRVARERFGVEHTTVQIEDPGACEIGRRDRS